jgi:hypothetical protein
MIALAGETRGAVMKNDTTRTAGGGASANVASSADFPDHAGACHHAQSGPSGAVQKLASSASSASRSASTRGAIMSTWNR